MNQPDLKTAFPIAFPQLSDEQLVMIKDFAECKTYKAGAALFMAGDREFKVQVVKSGPVEIVVQSGGEMKTIVTHDPKELTGDIENLTGRPANASAVARGDTEVY